MLGLDFSETKRQLAFIKSVLLHGNPTEEQKAAAGVADSLVTKLDTRQTIMWTVFSVFSVSCTIMILVFIDSFIEEQDKYQTVLTSAGRHRAEYSDLTEASSTGKQELIQ